MKFKFALAATAAALMIAAVPVFAHHSFSAEYDNTKPITIKGKFTKMDWVNPHSWVHIDVVGDDGGGPAEARPRRSSGVTTRHTSSSPIYPGPRSRFPLRIRTS